MSGPTDMNGRSLKTSKPPAERAALSPECKGREIIAEIVSWAVERAMLGEAEAHRTETKRPLDGKQSGSA